jgi:TRAP-type C4-dicarboxylate transport system permease large subunit
MIDSIYCLSRWTAVVGGTVLVALMLMVVASVADWALTGLGPGPVLGDFELVEVGVGIAVFFFLPWCYLSGGHAKVDLLYMHTPKWAQRGISTACLAAAGTLGIPIPPSVVLVIYAILKETDIAKLFLAAFVPGLLAALSFGILVLIVVEMGLITPPVGMNLFVISSLAKDVPITQTYRTILPFEASDFVRTAILVAFTAITLFVLWL